MKNQVFHIKLVAESREGGRQNNEDNFWVNSDIANNRTEDASFVKDAEIILGEKGSIMVVCDGMGGMNAGEVASQIAIDTMKEWFTDEKTTEQILSSPFRMEMFMHDAIMDADNRIKAQAENNPDQTGMGTTIVLAWIIKDIVFVAWCGDSRAYIYNNESGLKILTKDHSFVQQLVDSGEIDEEDALNHPNNNIITNSLGDSGTPAEPDICYFSIINGDIIMLCSDGLSGLLTNKEIAHIFEKNKKSLTQLNDVLFETAKNANWDDNVTMALCKVSNKKPNI
jgi:serine/threonine protein phosphatase PrpC